MRENRVLGGADYHSHPYSVNPHWSSRTILVKVQYRHTQKNDCASLDYYGFN